jgi:hypothetical protein
MYRKIEQAIGAPIHQWTTNCSGHIGATRMTSPLANIFASVISGGILLALADQPGAGHNHGQQRNLIDNLRYRREPRLVFKFGLKSARTFLLDGLASFATARFHSGF